MKFHVNPETGRTAECSASVRSCPHGSDDVHGSTPEEATRRFEDSLRDRTFVKMSRRQQLRKLFAVGSVSVALVSLTACDVSDITVPEPSSSKTRTIGKDGEVQFQGGSLKVSAKEVSQARARLEALKVDNDPSKAEQPVDSDYDNYDRESQFGDFLSDTVGRTEHRDVTDGVFESKDPTSRAIGGSFVDPYTGERVTIVKGSRTDADVDHVVPLREVIDSGGIKLSQEDRIKIANDSDSMGNPVDLPSNLAVVGSSVNRGKSDSDAEEWLPPYEPARCVYVVQQIDVKAAYDLAVDPGEKRALERVLESDCKTRQ